MSVAISSITWLIGPANTQSLVWERHNFLSDMSNPLRGIWKLFNLNLKFHCRLPSLCMFHVYLYVDISKTMNHFVGFCESLLQKSDEELLNIFSNQEDFVFTIIHQMVCLILSHQLDKLSQCVRVFLHVWLTSLKFAHSFIETSKGK